MGRLYLVRGSCETVAVPNSKSPGLAGAFAHVLREVLRVY